MVGQTSRGEYNRVDGLRHVDAHGEPSHRTAYFELRPLNSNHLAPRKINFQFSPDIPRLWLRNSPVMTHFVNGMNLVVIDLEQFMAQVLKAYVRAIPDPELQQQVRGFISQELCHSAAHQQYCQTLRQQGYQFQTYARFVHWIFHRVLEKFGLPLRLATIAGFEHLTALLAEITLRDHTLDAAHPTMKHLWQWHAAEELEHKTLVYDVLQAMHPNYWLRLAGIGMGTTIAAGLTISAMFLLAIQDREFFHWRSGSDLVKLFFTAEKLIPRSLVHLWRYAQPHFHPSHQETDHYAAQVFAAPWSAPEGM